MKRIYWIVGISILVVSMITAIVAWQQRLVIKDWVAARRTPAVPVAVTYEGIAESQKTLNKNEDTEGIAENNEITEDAEAVEIEIPAELNLAIPFTSQAPFSNWDAVHEETCEEASILMAGRFLLGRGISDAQDAETAMLEIVASEETDFGYGVSITAEETAEVLEFIYPSLDAEVVYDFSWDDVKTALAQGYPVIAPAAGRQLGNPNFTAPGPLYHMLVIKGYTADLIITNDPGTRKGADYTYSYDTLYDAIHDWNDGAVTTGQKAIIIVKPKP